MSQDKRYEGRRGVVVGGTHGIGLAIAEELVRAGAQVVVTGSSPANVANAADALGPQATTIVSDVTSSQDIAALAAQVGDIDALFINVGVGHDAPFGDVSRASWDRHYNVNAKGAFFTAQQLIPRVRAGAGIVFTTFPTGVAFPGGAVYASTKAAVRAFAFGLAAELVADGIRVNAVAPGFIDTPTFGVASATADERVKMKEAARALTPMQRLGTSSEVARAAIFLALEATFTTATEFQVDGGLSGISPPA